MQRKIAVPTIILLQRMFCVLILLLHVLMASAGPVQGQDKALIEAARKEGKITIFGSLQDQVMQPILTSFDKKYPGVKSVYWRASTTAVMDRAIN